MQKYDPVLRFLIDPTTITLRHLLFRCRILLDAVNFSARKFTKKMWKIWACIEIYNWPNTYYINALQSTLVLENSPKNVQNMSLYWDLWLTYYIKAWHRGAFCQFTFRWIYYCHSIKSTGKDTGKMHLCALIENNATIKIFRHSRFKSSYSGKIYFSVVIVFMQNCLEEFFT